MRFFKLSGLFFLVSSFLFLVLFLPPLMATDITVPGHPTIIGPAPVPPHILNPINYEVEKIGLLADINDQKARVVLRQTVKNLGHSNLELDFLAPLPLEGAVSGLTLLVDGKELTGKVYDRDEAFSVYQKIVSEIRDPALLEYAGHGLFRARIFPIPPKESRTLELQMDYLLPKDNGQVVFDFPLAGPLTADRKVEVVDVEVNVSNTPGLGSLYSPVSGVKVEKNSRGARASLELKDENVLNSFQLYFKVDQNELGGQVLSYKPVKNEDGFFLFTAEPSFDVKSSREPKNVIFLLDKSGSMDGTKFKQAKGALNFVLERLAPEDNFNLVVYGSGVETWQPELMEMSEANRKDALDYVNNLRSSGNTNISGALEEGLRLVNSGQATYLLFLTDGLPTMGETDELKLAKLAKDKNKNGARVFSFGVGNDVNSRLLDRLSGQGGGLSVFVKPDEDIEEKVASFFSRLTSPVLTGPKLVANVKTNSLIPGRLPDLFEGGQMVVVGRYPKGGTAKFTLSGKVGEKDSEFVYETTLAESTGSGDFIQQLWAQRRIGEIIDEIDLGQNRNNKELIDELVKLSKKYGIMTPYTSFLALEQQEIGNTPQLLEKAASNLEVIGQVTGEVANAQRSLKQSFLESSAPSSSSMDSKESLNKMAKLDLEVASSGAAELVPPQNLGGKTFFAKKGQLVDSELSETDSLKYKVIYQLSDEYFKLAKELEAGQKVWLSQNQPVIFNFRGQNYLIELPKPSVD